MDGTVWQSRNASHLHGSIGSPLRAASRTPSQHSGKGREGERSRTPRPGDCRGGWDQARPTSAAVDRKRWRGGRRGGAGRQTGEKGGWARGRVSECGWCLGVGSVQMDRCGIVWAVCRHIDVDRNESQARRGGKKEREGGQRKSKPTGKEGETAREGEHGGKGRAKKKSGSVTQENSVNMFSPA